MTPSFSNLNISLRREQCNKMLLRVGPPAHKQNTTNHMLKNPVIPDSVHVLLLGLGERGVCGWGAAAICAEVVVVSA